MFAAYNLSRSFCRNFSVTFVTGTPADPTVRPPRLNPAGANQSSDFFSELANVPSAATEGGTQTIEPLMVTLI